MKTLEYVDTKPIEVETTPTTPTTTPQVKYNRLLEYKPPAPEVATIRVRQDRKKKVWVIVDDKDNVLSEHKELLLYDVVFELETIDCLIAPCYPGGEPMEGKCYRGIAVGKRADVNSPTTTPTPWEKVGFNQFGGFHIGGGFISKSDFLHLDANGKGWVSRTEQNYDAQWID